jgi:hypothetical protein
MENQRQNPLAGHFRQPAIYLTLPSQGRWWSENALNMPANRELPIYPMSTKDEITLRTPDALLNGQGLIDVIQSCCPSIKDAWGMPSVDVDSVLIAIRIATYGNSMSFDSKCPHCGEDNTHDVDLGKPLSSLQCPDYSKLMHYKDLKIKFKPQHYFLVNKSNMMEFEEQKIMSLLNATDMDPDDRSKQLTDSMGRLFDFGITSCTQSTEYIELADGTRVTDEEFIKEFYKNAESAVITQLQKQVADFATQAKPEGLNLGCQECVKEYKVDLTFDYANFFAKGF